MSRSVGGEFEAMGLIERDLLLSQGLRPDGFVVDVGCGSGRLSKPLSTYLTGSYLGTDVVPELLEHARQSVARPDWRFELVDDLTIPAADASADIVCFFSVFTHLRHEESYCYLQEAKRVLQPQGCIVFSFLEFAIYSHWDVFESNLAGIGSDAPLNQFMSRDGIRAWADHLELTVKEIYDGDVATIPLTGPVTLERGEHYEKLGALGQSVAVLSAA
jgi:ubiquinone/menaquinone biosynthesis C-methylase UbiE